MGARCTPPCPPPPPPSPRRGKGVGGGEMGGLLADAPKGVEVPAIVARARIAGRKGDPRTPTGGLQGPCRG
jgi:hypothetical protein